jgi:hypothetical protein
MRAGLPTGEIAAAPLTRFAPIALVVVAILLVLIVPAVASADWAVAAYLAALVLLGIAGGCVKWLR